jgi:PTS system glucitol/sorbitol-specific IIA component
MSDSYYESTILRSGAEATELIEGGVLILYADPIPEALESVAVVHAPEAPPMSELRPGDTLWIGNQRVELTEVGERATENLRTLGHVVIHLNPDGSTHLLPGAVHGRGEIGVLESGTRLELHSANGKA